MRIFAQLPRGGSVKRQWVSRERQFSAVFAVYFSDTLEMRPALLHGDIQYVVCFSVIRFGLLRPFDFGK